MTGNTEPAGHGDSRKGAMGRPVDVGRRLRTMMLCLNRIFDESGISFIIVGVAMDILAQEVMERVDDISHSLATAHAPTEGPEGYLQEMTEYCECFAKHPTIPVQVLALLEQIDKTTRAICSIVAGHEVMESVFRSVSAMPDLFSFSFVNLLYTLLRADEDFDMRDFAAISWMSRLVNRILGVGLGPLLLNSASALSPGQDVHKLYTVLVFFANILGRQWNTVHHTHYVDFLHAVQHCLTHMLREERRLFPVLLG